MNFNTRDQIKSSA
uniref:Uncharacterized protein n=1 Tax=Anguilla anguilla TaxID=7936 RepID=A0A0E9XQR6_ANGAN